MICSTPRMTRGVEDLWGPSGDLFQEDEKDEIAAWTEISRGDGRATLSVQGFHDFLKPEIFQGDVTLSPHLYCNNIAFSGLINGGREIVVRYNFDKISVKLPTFLTLSTNRSWQPQVQAKPITMATYGSSVFKLRSVQSGDYRVSVQSTRSAVQFFQFQVNPLERSHLKIEIKALYDKK